MVDTVRTWPYLLTTQWVDNPTSKDTPAAVRDLIVSIPSVLGYGSYSATGFPAILRGTLNLAQYPGVTVGVGQTLGVRQANATAIQAASDQAATNGNFFEIPPGVYEFDNTTGIKWSDTTKYGAFTMRGTQQSSLIQFHANAPVLTIGDTSSNTGLSLANMSIDGLLLDYGVSQTGNTAATILTLGRLWRCNFSSMQIGTATIIPYNSLRMFTADTNGEYFFSNSMRDINIQNAQNRLFSFESSGTGNVFSNLYMNNATGPSTAGAMTLPFYMGGPIGNNENVFDQCNVEWCSANIIMHFNQGCGVFNSFHAENCILTGASPYFMYLEGESIVTMNRPTFLNLGINSGNFSGTARFAGFWADETLSMNDPWFVDSGNGTTRNATLVMFAQDTGNTPLASRVQVQLNGASFDGWDGFTQIDPTLPPASYGIVRRISGYNYPKIYPMAKAVTIANPPTTTIIPGSLGQETLIRFDNPISALVTIALGPNYMLGTDKGSTMKRPVGHQVFVLRDSSCTGNFNIVIKDSTTAGTTIGTFTGTGSVGTTQTFGWNGTAWAAI